MIPTVSFQLTVRTWHVGVSLEISNAWCKRLRTAPCVISYPFCHRGCTDHGCATSLTWALTSSQMKITRSAIAVMRCQIQVKRIQVILNNHSIQQEATSRRIAFAFKCQGRLSLMPSWVHRSWLRYFTYMGCLGMLC